MGVYLLLSYLPILNGRTYHSAYNILILNVSIPSTPFFFIKKALAQL